MKRLLFHQPCYISLTKNIQVLRVELSGNYTKMDFGYQPPEDNEIVGKIGISKNAYLLIGNEKEKFKLTQAVNIPIAPKYYHFKTTTDWLFFSLYFEPLPVKCCDFNLIEKKSDIESDFNFYSIELVAKKQYEIK